MSGPDHLWIPAASPLPRQSSRRQGGGQALAGPVGRALPLLQRLARQLPPEASCGNPLVLCAALYRVDISVQALDVLAAGLASVDLAKRAADLPAGPVNGAAR